MKMPRRDMTSQAAAKRRQREWTKDRDAFAHLNGHELSLYVSTGDEDDEHSETLGVPSVRVGMRKDREWTFINLTSLTADELEVVRMFWERALEYALPICQVLDQNAQKNFDESGSDDSLMRLYRPAPSLFVHPSRKRGDDPGLPLGPHGAAELDRGSAGDAASDDDAGSRARGGVVPDADAQDVGRVDDGPEVDSVPGVGEARGGTGVPPGLPASDAGAPGTPSDS